MTLRQASPAKINLLLNILGRRPDGFHELETVFLPIPLCDELECTRQPHGVRLTCNESQLPTDARNLVCRAAEAFLQAAGIAEGVRIHLEKRVPLAAGLGGGSSNAAATLLALNRLFGQPLPPATLDPLAAQLGSDVPFFLQSGPALGTGRGERIEPLPPFPVLAGKGLLLIHPGFGVSTAWAYGQLHHFPHAQNGRPGRARQLVALLQAGRLELAASECYNALEEPVFVKYPFLALAREFFAAQGALVARMSGSGSTLFALTPTPADAESLRQQYQTHFGGEAWSTVLTID